MNLMECKLFKWLRGIWTWICEEPAILCWYITYVVFLIFFSNVGLLEQWTLEENTDFYQIFFRNQGNFVALIANMGIIFLVGWECCNPTSRRNEVSALELAHFLILMLLSVFVYIHAHHEIIEGLKRKELLEKDFWSPLLYLFWVLGLLFLQIRLAYARNNPIVYQVK